MNVTKKEREETMASIIDGEINYMLKTKKENKEFKRNKNFYTLKLKRKKNKKNMNSIGK